MLKGKENYRIFSPYPPPNRTPMFSNTPCIFSRKNKGLQTQHDQLMEKVNGLRAQLLKLEKFNARITQEIARLNALETPEVI